MKQKRRETARPREENAVYGDVVGISRKTKCITISLCNKWIGYPTKLVYQREYVPFSEFDGPTETTELNLDMFREKLKEWGERAGYESARNVSYIYEIMKVGKGYEKNLALRFRVVSELKDTRTGFLSYTAETVKVDVTSERAELVWDLWGSYEKFLNKLVSRYFKKEKREVRMVGGYDD